MFHNGRNVYAVLYCERAMSMSGCFIMDLAYLRFSTGDRTFFIAVISAMSDLTLTNGECEDRHGP